MRFREFRIHLILRTVILLLTVIAVGMAFYLIRDKNLVFIPLFMILAVAWQIGGILRQVNKLNQELAEVFERIREVNYLPSLTRGHAIDSFSDLVHTINDLFSIIHQAEVQKEAYNLFTEILVSLLPVGVILVKPDGRIKLINDAAQDLLGVPRLSRWDDLERKAPSLAETVKRLDGGGSDLLKTDARGQSIQLSVTVRTVVLLGETHRVISFHDIRSSIEKTEIRAWTKLFRVIRHEILNSVTPISSLAETMQLIVAASSGGVGETPSLSARDREDILECANAIRLRSEGLFNFVNLYRDISQVPVPVKVHISLAELFRSIHVLVRPKLEEGGVRFTVDISGGDLMMMADFGLMQQVMLNLVNNSLAAMDNSAGPVLRIQAQKSGPWIYIRVEDNGHGIPDDMLEDIFVPFFTTRKEGSGLGLSLVKQIIISHGGHISVESRMNEYTRFVIEMPAGEP